MIFFQAIGDHCKMVVELKYGSGDSTISHASVLTMKALISLCSRDLSIIRHIGVVMSFDMFVIQQFARMWFEEVQPKLDEFNSRLEELDRMEMAEKAEHLEVGASSSSSKTTANSNTANSANSNAANSNAANPNAANPANSSTTSLSKFSESFLEKHIGRYVRGYTRDLVTERSLGQIRRPKFMLLTNKDSTCDDFFGEILDATEFQSFEHDLDGLLAIDGLIDGNKDGNNNLSGDSGSRNGSQNGRKHSLLNGVMSGDSGTESSSRNGSKEGSQHFPSSFWKHYSCSGSGNGHRAGLLDNRPTMRLGRRYSIAQNERGDPKVTS
jgi:hypothetical protein